MVWKKNLPCSPCAVWKTFLLVAEGQTWDWPEDWSTTEWVMGRKEVGKVRRSTILCPPPSLPLGEAWPEASVLVVLLYHLNYWTTFLPGSFSSSSRHKGWGSLDFHPWPQSIHIIRVTLQLQVSLFVLCFRVPHLSSAPLHVLMLSDDSSGAPEMHLKLIPLNCSHFPTVPFSFFDISILENMLHTPQT